MLQNCPSTTNKITSKFQVTLWSQRISNLWAPKAVLHTARAGPKGIKSFILSKWVMNGPLFFKNTQESWISLHLEEIDCSKFTTRAKKGHTHTSTETMNGPLMQLSCNDGSKIKAVVCLPPSFCKNHSPYFNRIASCVEKEKDPSWAKCGLFFLGTRETLVV